MRLVLSTLLSCAIALAGLSACGGGGGSSPSSAAPTPTPTPPNTPITAGAATPSPGSIYLGGFINPSGLAYGNTPPFVAAFESSIGRKLALDMQFGTFNTKFGGRGEQDDYSNGRISIFSWNCGASNAAVANGSIDDTIRLQADSVRAYGWPVFVRYLWDMNLPATNFGRTACHDSSDSPNGVFNSANFIAAWIHIRQIFAQEGAVNAIWLWTVSGTGTNAKAYYPGSQYVDWVGFDSFDITGTTFAATMQPMYSLLAPLGKPIMVSETGAAEAQQTTFFNDAATELPTQFPQVKAFLYYDGIGLQDWRIAPASLPAFSALANSPYLAARYVAP